MPTKGQVFRRRLALMQAEEPKDSFDEFLQAQARRVQSAACASWDRVRRMRQAQQSIELVDWEIHKAAGVTLGYMGHSPRASTSRE